jgi:hypothetical protein
MLAGIARKEERHRRGLLHKKEKKQQQPEKEKQDLSQQIEETLSVATNHIRAAFLKKDRPDHAYQLQLAMQSRPLKTYPY